MFKNFYKSNLKLKAAIILLAGALLLPSCTSQIKDENADPDGKCIFVSTRNGYRDIYISDLNGENLKQLTSDKAHYGWPAFTSDGRICFASQETGTWQIYTMNRNGKGIKAVTKSRAINNYAPYPTLDGRIVFISDMYGEPEIFSIKQNGTDRIQLTYNSTYVDCPVVMDDGRIFYISSKTTKPEVWMMTADGADQKQITFNTNNIRSVAVVPPRIKDFLSRTSENTGLAEFTYNVQPRIIYEAKDGLGNTQLYRMNIDGKEKRALTNLKGANSNPVVLPDGHVAFMSNNSKNADIWVMTPDGYNLKNLTVNPAYDDTK